VAAVRAGAATGSRGNAGKTSVLTDLSAGLVTRRGAFLATLWVSLSEDMNSPFSYQISKLQHFILKYTANTGNWVYSTIEKPSVEVRRPAQRPNLHTGLSFVLFLG
jgi:hypothetical protein